ncbi:hypothetical protein O5824_27380, partial [Escherichia coli]|nr:hypothetical protein [Escherichia coli]
MYWISDIFVLLKWSKKVGYRMSNNFNSNGYPEEMAEDIDLQRAERIKKAILSKFTYERMEELSGINIG